MEPLERYLEYSAIRAEAQRVTAEGKNEFVWAQRISAVTLQRIQDAGHEAIPLITVGYRIKLNPLGFLF